MNYWKIEFNDLPSLGQYYSLDTEIRIRTMTVRDVKYLATFNKSNAITITNELLQRCLKLKHLKFEDILLADREYLLFWLRTNTFIRSSGYQIKIPECPTCKNSIEQEVKLNSFKTDYIKSKFEECILSGINLTIPLKHPTIKDLNDARLVENDEFLDLALYIDTDNSLQDKARFIMNLQGMDFVNLKYTIDQMKCGMHKTIQVKCPVCGEITDVKLIVADENMFTHTSIKEILELITRIAKYANLQITDDWPWMEVEIEQEIVNKMIKDENAETQKEINKAKSQANAHTPSTSSVKHPRI